ncbi:hypothetical protein GCM10009756_24590 [Pseudokineococcus marinus]
MGTALPLACAAALLVGCSGGSGAEVVVPDGTVTGSSPAVDPAPTPPSAAPSPTGGDGGAGPSAPSAVEGDVLVVEETPRTAPDQPPHEAELRVTTPVSGEQVAVVAAWEAFWEQLAVTFGVPRFDPTAMGEVATGEALAAVRTYADDLAARDVRLSGRATTVADAVVVDGDTAVVEGCSLAQDVEIDDRGAPQEAPRGPTSLRTELVREGGAWRVSSYGIVEGLC